MTTYTIPAAEYRAEMKTVAVEHVKVEDTYAVAGKERPVGSVKTGTKWVELRAINGDLILRAERGTEVPVARDVETQASITARYRAQRNQTIVKWLEEHEPQGHVKKAMAGLQKTVAGGYSVDYRGVGDLITAQATDKVHDGLAHVLSMRVGTELEGEVLDHVAVVQRYRDQLKERMLEHSLSAGLSRSTSVVANVMSDAEREVIADFIRHDHWVWSF